MPLFSSEPARLCPGTLRTGRALVALGVLTLVAASAGRAESAFVRVNQLGYEAGTENRAYLMSPGSESGAIFHVIDSQGATEISKAIGANLGPWGNFTVYALD